MCFEEEKKVEKILIGNFFCPCGGTNKPIVEWSFKCGDYFKNRNFGQNEIFLILIHTFQLKTIRKGMNRNGIGI